MLWGILIIIYLGLFISDQKWVILNGVWNKKWKPFITEIFLRLKFGQVILNGDKLLLQLNHRVFYRFGIDQKGSVNPYKYFHELWFVICKISQQTGNFSDVTLKNFKLILERDLKIEKELRNFIINNLFQMVVVGIMTNTVLITLGLSFEFSDFKKHLCIQIFIQLLGILFFILAINSFKKKIFKDCIELTVLIQKLIILGQSGLSFGEVVEISGLKNIHQLKFQDRELLQFKEMIVLLAETWRIEGKEISFELQKLLNNFDDYYGVLKQKMMRIASSARLIFISLFFLGGYLVNILILLQTIVEKSFYTGP